MNGARDPEPGSPDARLLVWWGLAAAVALIGLAVWQGQAYWEYSDGVYSLSARELLHGRSLYHDFAAAQPPPIYLLGAGVLAISDTPAAIRIAMALAEAATSLLVLVAVWRLTRSRPAALAAALACFVTPWSLREHAQLLPETLAAPLLLAAALAAGRRGGAIAVGGLAALAVAFKLAFAVPALAIVLLRGRADRGRTLVAFAAAGVVLGLACLLGFGAPMLEQAVGAQRESGYASLRYVAGLWAQAGWNLLPLLALAGLGWRRRAALADVPLARSLAAASLGALLLLATLLKDGSYLTAVVIVEPPLLCLAAAGLVVAWREHANGRGGRAIRPLTAGIALALALGVAQAASLLVAPGRAGLFTRPLAASGPTRMLATEEVDRNVDAIRGCPPGTTFAGDPYLAFVAHRAIAGGQPDQFIIRNAPSLAGFRRQADADPAICLSAPAPTGR